MCVSCYYSNNKTVIEVSDISQIIEISDKKLYSVYSLELEIIGTIDGEAKIRLNDIKKEIIKNIFIFKYSADWYSNNATIIYEPLGASKGSFVIKYRFY